jgi:hypothetical protein
LSLISFCNSFFIILFEICFIVGEGFKDLIKSKAPGMDRRSLNRNNASTWIKMSASKFATKLRSRVHRELPSDARVVAASVDGWTESATLDQFDGFSIHYITRVNNEWVLRVYKLPLESFPASHTSTFPLFVQYLLFHSLLPF